MKLAPVTNLHKRNTANVKEKLTMTSCQQIVTSFSFFRFMVNLEQSASRIPEVWSVKLIFSLIAIFYLTKTENKTKKYLTQISYYCFE